VPAYKARLVQRRERLAEMEYLEWLRTNHAEMARQDALLNAAIRRLADQLTQPPIQQTKKAEAEAETLSQPQLCELFRQAGCDVDEGEPIPIVRRSRPTSFFERLLTAAAKTIRHLAQDFEPRKGPGDARFF
jgi:hypothetical protein